MWVFCLLHLYQHLFGLHIQSSSGKSTKYKFSTRTPGLLSAKHATKL